MDEGLPYPAHGLTDLVPATQDRFARVADHGEFTLVTGTKLAIPILHADLLTGDFSGTWISLWPLGTRFSLWTLRTLLTLRTLGSGQALVACWTGWSRLPLETPFALWPCGADRPLLTPGALIALGAGRAG